MLNELDMKLWQLRHLQAKKSKMVGCFGLENQQKMELKGVIRHLRANNASYKI